MTSDHEAKRKGRMEVIEEDHEEDEEIIVQQEWSNDSDGDFDENGRMIDKKRKNQEDSKDKKGI